MSKEQFMEIREAELSQENKLKKQTMEKSNLVKAVIAVMNEVKGIEKSMTVGTGAASYKGVPDKEVKKIIGESMAKNGLCILPLDTTAQTKVERWEETYNGQAKMRQSIFTEVTTKYLLMHESGENQVISGYGHGVDSQDKGAGKATTYALKNTLLYTFLVPTGSIDDTDNTHSDTIQVPSEKKFIQDPIEKIKATKDAKELTALYNAMPPAQQKAEHIINAFKQQKQSFKK